MEFPAADVDNGSNRRDSYSRHDESFKRQAVEILLSSGRPVTSVARELGIEQSVLHRWRNKYRHDVETVDCSNDGCRDEMVRMKGEISTLRDQVETLREIVRKSYGDRYSV